MMFLVLLKPFVRFLSGNSEKQEAGYHIAQSRSIDKVAHELVDVYHKVMEL